MPTFAHHSGEGVQSSPKRSLFGVMGNETLFNYLHRSASDPVAETQLNRAEAPRYLA